MPSEKGRRNSSKKDTKPTRIKIEHHSGIGQYRKYIKGKMCYFGSDRETTMARYALLTEPVGANILSAVRPVRTTTSPGVFLSRSSGTGRRPNKWQPIIWVDSSP